MRGPRPGSKRCAYSDAERNREYQRAYQFEWSRRHRERRRLQRNAYRAKIALRRKVDRAARLALRADRTERAICTLCEAPVATGRLRCEACLADNRKAVKELQRRRKAEGRCWRCGRAAAPFVNCAVCREKLRTRTANLHRRGRCHCGSWAPAGKKRCGWCKNYGKAYKARRAAAGLCKRHGNPVLPGRKSCPRCVETYRKYNAMRRTKAAL